jgi:P27 family predicted phage terminase small subunit
VPLGSREFPPKCFRMSKRKPIAEKQLENHPNKRLLQPKAKAGFSVPTQPPSLSHIGAAEWTRLTDALQQIGKLQDSDCGLLYTAAMAYQRVIEAEGIITEKGPIVEGDKGVIVKNPACQLSRDYNTQYHKAIQLLGLNAAARPDASPADLNEDPHGLLD